MIQASRRAAMPPVSHLLKACSIAIGWRRIQPPL